MSVAEKIDAARRAGRKEIAWLVDPDKTAPEELAARLQSLPPGLVDYLFLGGSLVRRYRFAELAEAARASCDLPVILFPGSAAHVAPGPDAMFFLSLISGRNAELLIGQHVIAAPLARQYGLEPLPAGYMLVDSGAQTSASYMSGEQPLPRDKPDLAAATALAGYYLGLRIIYLDGGSGAKFPVPPELVAAVAETAPAPVIVGGGLRAPETALAWFRAGAQIVVAGNALENGGDFGLLRAIRDGLAAD